LVQGLFIRFNTPIGELSTLGHPDFGSRLARKLERLLHPLHNLKSVQRCNTRVKLILKSPSA
jgi:hypothetical protein